MFTEIFLTGPTQLCVDCPPLIAGGAVEFSGEVTINLTANPTNNLTDPLLPDVSTVLLTATADTVVTGLEAQDDGTLFLLWNNDPTPNYITLSHADGLSLAANRFYLPDGLDVVLGQYNGVLLRYTASLNGGVGGWLSIPGDAKETHQTLTDQANIAWDVNKGESAQVTLAASRNFSAPTNLRQGATYMLQVIQGGTGSYTVAWDAVFLWPGGVAPTLSTAVGAKDIVALYCPDGVNLWGVANLNFS